MAVLLALMTLVTFIGQQDDIGQGSYDVAGAFLVTLLQTSAAGLPAAADRRADRRDHRPRRTRARQRAHGRARCGRFGGAHRRLRGACGRGRRCAAVGDRRVFRAARRPVRATVQDLQPLLAARVHGQPQRLGARGPVLHQRAPPGGREPVRRHLRLRTRCGAAADDGRPRGDGRPGFERPLGADELRRDAPGRGCDGGPDRRPAGD